MLAQSGVCPRDRVWLIPYAQVIHFDTGFTRELVIGVASTAFQQSPAVTDSLDFRGLVAAGVGFNAHRAFVVFPGLLIFGQAVGATAGILLRLQVIRVEYGLEEGYPL